MQMESHNERVSLQGYIYEDDLKKAVKQLRNYYKDSELVREGIRCLARREGILSTGNEEAAV